MPTARELLEQADALMRRNRGGEPGVPVLTEHVADALGETLSGPSTRERSAERASAPPADMDAADAPASEELAVALDRSLQDGVEPPILTDVVEEVAVDLLPLPSGKAEEDWLGPDTVDPELNSITGPSPDSIAVVPPVTLRSPRRPTSIAAAELAEMVEEHAPPTLSPAGVAEVPDEPMAPASPPAFELVEDADERTPASVAAGELAEIADERTLAPSVAAVGLAEAAEQPTPVPSMSGAELAEAEEPMASVAGVAESGATPVPERSSSSPEPAAADDDERWRALTEQVSMQVLQRLDLFVDSGLKSQLAAHLQPIVARAGNELVEAINDHVGQLVRSYVAEAIEREIAQWRQSQR